MDLAPATHQRQGDQAEDEKVPAPRQPGRSRRARTAAAAIHGLGGIFNVCSRVGVGCLLRARSGLTGQTLVTHAANAAATV